MKKLLVEFIGTFFLVLTITVGAVCGKAGDFAPLAIGATLMIMVFAGGHISGGHFNPAVSLGAMLRGALPSKDIVGYIIAQILGAVVASIVGTKLIAPEVAVETATISTVPAFVAELLYTFALVYVVLNTATAKGTDGNSFYGLAIGFTVVVGAFTVGSISLGAFNPAVAVGLVVSGKLAAAQIWIPLVACFLGGALAAFTFNFANGKD